MACFKVLTRHSPRRIQPVAWPRFELGIPAATPIRSVPKFNAKCFCNNKKVVVSAILRVVEGTIKLTN